MNIRRRRGNAELSEDWLRPEDVQLACLSNAGIPNCSNSVVYDSIQRMLAVREDVFHDYTEQAFLAYLEEVAQVQQTRRLKTGGRLLLAYQRHT